MRGYSFRCFCATAGLLLLSLPLLGQAGKDRASSGDASGQPARFGYPQDWSSRHLLMPGLRAEDALAAGERDPRHVYNLVMRQVALENGRRPVLRPGAPRHRRHIKIDWAVSLENGYVPLNQYPAK